MKNNVLRFLFIFLFPSCCFGFVPNRLLSGTDFKPIVCIGSLAASSEAKCRSLELEKPLGMILEEVEEGEPKGVLIRELVEGGSAISSNYRDVLVGSKITSIMGQDVSKMDFDSVMSIIVNSPSQVAMKVMLDPIDEKPKYPLGTEVTITVIQSDGKPLSLKTKVGQNLRKMLLTNNVEVYRGFRQVTGNCGGAGQCTFCAAEFLDSDGWEPRSEYESGKLKTYPNSRLSCLTNIQGPATIKL